MPSGKCNGCGRETNSTVSDWWEPGNYYGATKCFAAWDGKKWVKGCGYDDLREGSFLKKFADKLISGEKNG